MIVRRGALTDHYVEDDRSVVMVEESVLGLSPIATAILEAVPEGVDVALEAITAHVVATFGPPDGGESAKTLTEQQIWDLVAHRVLVIAGDEKSRKATSSTSTYRFGSNARDTEPAVAVAALRAALRLLRSDNDQRWTPPDSIGPQGLVRAAHQHHVVPYLAAHLDRLDIPGQAKSELEAAAGRQRAGAARLAADLSVVIGILSRESVRAVAFKGVALAEQAYGDFAVRGAGDLDLLVPPEDVARAHRLLVDAGWVPAGGYPSPGPSWAWRHLVRTGNELTLVGARSNIDLHWHLMPMRSAFPDFESLWERHVIVFVDGQPVPTLAPYDAMAHSAAHAAKDRWRWLRSLLDVHVQAADQQAWLGADRPLRPDQLVTVGLAAAEFGLPSAAPTVVRVAMRDVDEELRRRVHREQDETGPQHRPLAVPGINFVRRLRAVNGASELFVEGRRLLSESTFPSRYTTAEDSPHAMVAAPRVLFKRTCEVVSRLTAKRETPSAL